VFIIKQRLFLPSLVPIPRLIFYKARRGDRIMDTLDKIGYILIGVFALQNGYLRIE